MLPCAARAPAPHVRGTTVYLEGSLEEVRQLLDAGHRPQRVHQNAVGGVLAGARGAAAVALRSAQASRLRSTAVLECNAPLCNAATDQLRAIPFTWTSC